MGLLGTSTPPFSPGFQPVWPAAFSRGGRSPRQLGGPGPVPILREILGSEVTKSLKIEQYIMTGHKTSKHRAIYYDRSQKVKKLRNICIMTGHKQS